MGVRWVGQQPFRLNLLEDKISFVCVQKWQNYNEKTLTPQTIDFFWGLPGIFFFKYYCKYRGLEGLGEH